MLAILIGVLVYNCCSSNADMEAPGLLNCSSNITSYTDEGVNTSSTVVFTDPTATDNVDAAPPVTCSPLSGSVFAFGDTTVDCTSTDVAGNVGNCSFVVTVGGNEKNSWKVQCVAIQFNPVD